MYIRKTQPPESVCCCVKSVVWESDLEEAETIFTVFQIHLLGVKVIQPPAESRRLGLLEGLHLRGLVDGLQRAGSARHTATGSFISMLPVLIHFVFRGDTITWREDHLSWRITSLVTHQRSESKLTSRQKLSISYCILNKVVDLFYMIHISDIHI